ncbi:MAG TPA: hypothetical protein VGO47_12220 [Chlamydiales bacterium]|nr:hypothetical protein [Chlamydiales bacterium]
MREATPTPQEIVASRTAQLEKKTKEEEELVKGKEGRKVEETREEKDQTEEKERSERDCTEAENPAENPSPVDQDKYNEFASYDTPLMMVIAIAESEKVYKQWIKMRTMTGRQIWIRAIIDGGAMRNTMCYTKWEECEKELGEIGRSLITMRVADNHKVKSMGRWIGQVTVSGVEVQQTFDYLRVAEDRWGHLEWWGLKKLHGCEPQESSNCVQLP